MCVSDWLQGLTFNGSRSSSASYFSRGVQDRPNLDILLNSHVVKLSSMDGTTFTTVELIESISQGECYLLLAEFSDCSRMSFLGERPKITARQEVVLSAGSIGTPTILLHSGIGNATELAGIGIEPVINLPSVGKNLTDHPVIILLYLVNTTDTFDTVLRNDTLYQELLNEWETNRTGMFTNTLGHHAAWLRLPDNSSVFQQYPDPANGPNSAHFELIFGVSTRF